MPNNMRNDGKGTNPSQENVKDTFLDFTGIRSGIPITRNLVIVYVVSILAFILLSKLPLSHYGEKTALALGFFVAMIMQMIFLRIPIVIPAIIIIVGGTMLELWTWGDVSATLGNSPLYSIMGMMIVAMGAEFTPIGKRIAYGFLKLFGQKPTRVIVVVGATTALISAFVSNIASIILMSSIAAGLLAAMKEEPGQSKIGRTLMPLISAASMVGGCALISGSPIGNTVAIGFMENASGGAYTVTYQQWAYMGILTFCAVVIPLCYIYIKCNKLKDEELSVLPQSYYDELLASLGPIGGSEMRWLIIVVAMVATMLSGVMGTAQAAMLFALISMLPLVGTVPVSGVFQKLPFQILVSSGMLPILARLFSDHGLGELMSDLIMPLVGNFSPLMFSIFSAVTMGVLVNGFVNATQPSSSLVISIMTPICMSLGYNPTIVMMPTLFLGSMFFVFGMNNIMLINYGYGYWEMNDTVLPGAIGVLFVAIVSSVICCLLGPVFGMPLTI